MQPLKLIFASVLQEFEHFQVSVRVNDLSLEPTTDIQRTFSKVFDLKRNRK